MIIIEDMFKQFPNSPEITIECKVNAALLVAKVNNLLFKIGTDHVIITSGFRTQEWNKKIGGSANSSHCLGMAVDIADPDESLGKYCQNNILVLRDLSLYMESLSVTHKSDKPSGKWVHWTTRCPRSGNIIFIP